MKVLVCGGRDYCEFYTQSDAEGVIKNLKNNIAAKDKLIQSLIDFDSEEVKRLEADNNRLREKIAAVRRQAFDDLISVSIDAYNAIQHYAEVNETTSFVATRLNAAIEHALSDATTTEEGR